MEIIISIAAVFIGILSGLNAILLADIRRQQEKYSNENREDHQLIFAELKLHQTIEKCDERIKACNGHRDKKLEIANKADELVTEERRRTIDDKIEGLSESVHGMGVSLDNLSICISKYTKGVCP